MPGFPHAAPSVIAIRGSVYSALAERLERFEGEVYPLHVGDTWMEPAVGCRMEDLHVAEHPGMHRYTAPQGLAALLETAAAYVERRTGVPTHRGQLLITTGATGALGAAVGALVGPGEEVLVVAPHWPLIDGIVRSFHGMPVDVPLPDTAGSPETAVRALEAARTPRSVALYLNTPNNPSGRVIPRPWLEAMVSWAVERKLWIFADEVYERYQYEGEHLSCRVLAPEHTFAAYSFSKAWGMAGNRCGFMVGPERAMIELRKIGTHTFYSAPTAAQLAGVRALGPAGDAWVETARQQYRAVGEQAAARLGLEPPEGGAFLFFDVAPHLDERGLAGLLEDCVEHGLLLAPGPSFGPYPTHVRLCFTAVDPERTGRGIEILARLLGR